MSALAYHHDPLPHALLCWQADRPSLIDVVFAFLHMGTKPEEEKKKKKRERNYTIGMPL